MTKKLLLSAFFLLHLLFLSPFSFAQDVTLTQTEYQTVLTALQNSKEQLMQSKTELETLKKESTTLSTQLTKQSQYLQEQEKELNKAIDDKKKAEKKSKLFAGIALGIALAWAVSS